MEALNGWIDTHSWNAQAFDALLSVLRTGRPSELGRSARLAPTYREHQFASRLIAKPDPEQLIPAIDRLAQQSLADSLRFLTGCRDLIVAFLGIDPAGIHLNHVGDAASVRTVIADSLSSIALASSKQTRPRIRAELHWRTEDRLERTFAAVEQLLERLTDRRDVVFVAAWRLGTDSPARADHSLGLQRGIAIESLVEFERHVLSDQKQIHPVS